MAGMGTADGTSRRTRLAAVLTPVVVVLTLLGLARRRTRAGGRPGDGDATAGVREPRRPLPTSLVGAAAADPADPTG